MNPGAHRCGRTQQRQGRARHGQRAHALRSSRTGGFPKLGDDVFIILSRQILEPMPRDDQLAALAVDVREMRLRRHDAFEA